MWRGPIRALLSRNALPAFHGVGYGTWNALADSRPWLKRSCLAPHVPRETSGSRTRKAVARGRQQVCASRASTLAATAGAVQAVRQLLAGGDAAAAQQFADGASRRQRLALRVRPEALCDTQAARQKSMHAMPPFGKTQS